MKISVHVCVCVCVCTWVSWRACPGDPDSHLSPGTTVCCVGAMLPYDRQQCLQIRFVAVLIQRSVYDGDGIVMGV
jgi:hypothetical protein